jgi:hypothetical protein
MMISTNDKSALLTSVQQQHRRPRLLMFDSEGIKFILYMTLIDSFDVEYQISVICLGKTLKIIIGI